MALNIFIYKSNIQLNEYNSGQTTTQKLNDQIMPVTLERIFFYLKWLGISPKTKWKLEENDNPKWIDVSNFDGAKNNKSIILFLIPCLKSWKYFFYSKN